MTGRQHQGSALPLVHMFI